MAFFSVTLDVFGIEETDSNHTLVICTRRNMTFSLIQVVNCQLIPYFEDDNPQ